MLYIFGLFIGFVLSFFIDLYWAWAASYLWEWFAVPTGLPKLGIMHIFGFFLLHDCLCVKICYKNKIDWGQSLMVWTIGPLIMLLFGYIVKGLL